MTSSRRSRMSLQLERAFHLPRIATFPPRSRIDSPFLVLSKVVFVYNSAGSLSIPQLSTGTPSLGGVASLRREEGLKVRSLRISLC